MYKILHIPSLYYVSDSQINAKRYNGTTHKCKILFYRYEDAKEYLRQSSTYAIESGDLFLWQGVQALDREHAVNIYEFEIIEGV